MNKKKYGIPLRETRTVKLMADQQQFIQACKNNEPQALKKLYMDYADTMYGICVRYCGNAEDAKDSLQEGFIKIIQNLHQYNHTGSFVGWMKRIMVHTALEKYRDKFVSLKQDGEPGDFMLKSWEQNLEQLEADDLLKLVQELTPQYRLVFNLYAIEGYSHKEISSMLNISEGTSKSNLSRAREYLKMRVNELRAELKKIG